MIGVWKPIDDFNGQHPIVLIGVPPGGSIIGRFNDYQTARETFMDGYVFPGRIWTNHATFERMVFNIAGLWIYSDGPLFWQLLPPPPPQPKKSAEGQK